MSEMAELLESVCIPQVSRPWSCNTPNQKGWKEVLALDGLIVINDLSGCKDFEILSGSQARLAFDKCECTVESRQMTVDEWRDEYTRVKANPPKPNDILCTSDGELVRLNIDFRINKEPFIYARIYVPNLVGSDLAWYAESVKERKLSGMKVIMLPKARNAVIRQFGVQKDFVGVQAIRVIHQSGTELSFLGEVADW